MAPPVVEEEMHPLLKAFLERKAIEDAKEAAAEAAAEAARAAKYAEDYPD